MKDNFSKQALAYSLFRPQYPDAMIDYLVSLAANKTSALDVATGSGQVAHKLSPYFEIVYATDISAKQLENAIPADNIIYMHEAAEKTSFADSQFDLITVAQAVHWFNFDKFYDEIKRILKPDGIFCVLGYGLFTTNSESDKILQYYYHNIVGPFWDVERKYLENNYKTIPFPFTEIATPVFTNEYLWSYEQLVGYLESWSATQHYKDRTKQNPIDLIAKDLRISWDNGNQKVSFPMLLRVGQR